MPADLTRRALAHLLVGLATLLTIEDLIWLGDERLYRLLMED